ncbi:MAG: sensor histidine kinase [Candidatus Marinimicrobia bacterium]|nr:sensor histidine kinase [Candidatus Neomarinimicrobiota bacterium]
MKATLEQYFLGKYFPRESEEFFQARVLLSIHMTLIVMMIFVLFVTPAKGVTMTILQSIFVLSFASIFFIRFGFLPAVTLASYSGMAFLATMAVYTKPYYQNFEVYTLTAFHMFITIVASLLTRQRFYTYFTTASGVVYIIILLFYRGLRMADAHHPLEIDDYVIGTVILIITGFILRNSLDRRRKLLDIAESESRKNLKQARELELSLKEKEVLLQEVHHRVKNNLNVAISLLNMQIRQLDESNSAIGTLQDSIGRLNSMALVHERLYAGNNFNAIEFKPYITAILHTVMRSMENPGIKFKITVEDDLNIELAKAIPVGLIFNELITNVYKHAFPSGETGQAELSLISSSDDQVTLIVQDTGAGMPEWDNSKRQSLGLHLVTLLTEQLGGHLQIENDSGTKTTIKFPLF